MTRQRVLDGGEIDLAKTAAPLCRSRRRCASSMHQGKVADVGRLPRNREIPEAGAAFGARQVIEAAAFGARQVHETAAFGARQISKTTATAFGAWQVGRLS